VPGLEPVPSLVLLCTVNGRGYHVGGWSVWVVRCERVEIGVYRGVPSGHSSHLSLSVDDSLLDAVCAVTLAPAMLYVAVVLVT
jgi:hypothetical protein